MSDRRKELLRQAQEEEMAEGAKAHEDNQRRVSQNLIEETEESEKSKERTEARERAARLVKEAEEENKRMRVAEVLT